jgi:hypothetical protein
MRYMNPWMVVILALAALQPAACQRQSAALPHEKPAELSKIDGSNLIMITLTDRAIQRLDLKTDQVTEQEGKKVVPFSSMIYDPQGQTWVYISPQPRTFVRHKIDVDYIKNNLAVLNDGPPVGTVVASVAVAELYGAEFKVGH